MIEPSKYDFSYTPRVPPATLKAFLWSIIRRNPVMWSIFLILDVVHHVRYSICFLIVGAAVDTLGRLEAGAALPPEMWLYTLAIFTVLAIGELAHVGESYVHIRWMGWMRPQIRADFLNYTLQHSYQYLQNHFAGALTRKITEGTEHTLNLNASIRYDIFSPMVVLCASLFSLLYIHPLYGFIVFLFICTIAIPVLVNLKTIHRRALVYSEARSQVTGHVVDALTNVSSIKSFAALGEEISHHNDEAAAEIKSWMKLSRKMIQVENLRRLALVIFVSSMMLLCLYGWEHGLITLGNVASIMGISISVAGPVWTLGGGISLNCGSFGICI